MVNEGAVIDDDFVGIENDPIEIPDITDDNIEDYEPQYYWSCPNCDRQVPATRDNYLKTCRNHPKRNGCSIHLVDEDGIRIAESLQDAIKKGIFAPLHIKTPEYIEEDTGKKGSKTITDGQPLYLGYFKTEKVELDARLFLYRQLFIQEDLVPSNISMGDFLLSCVETLLEATGRQVAIVQRSKKGGQ